MNLTTGSIRSAYFKYLGAAFGSSLISSIYGVVDMAMVGQYHGPEGAAAMAVIAPIWNIIYSFGLLTGIGGSVLYSTEKGTGRDGNGYFSLALWETLGLALLCWAGLILFEEPLLGLFGANGTLLPLAKRYLTWVKFVIPSFLLSQMLSAFLRNDGDPGRATKAVLFGGIFNVFGDYFFVFVLDMGIEGAGLATAMGSVLSVLVMCTHFLSKKNTLRLTRVPALRQKSLKILVTGFSTFFIDVAMGILTMLFNRQIMRYLGADALAVYGVIVNISTFVQCCAYSVGQAAQPILSVNFGAHLWDRIRETLKYALYTALVFGLIWTVVIFAVPNGFIRIFMTPTDSVLAMAPKILRLYGLSFLLLPLNVVSTYYFQAIMRPGTSFVVSVGRGVVVSGTLILVLPLLFGADALWLAMPVTELIVAVYVVLAMRRSVKPA